MTERDSFSERAAISSVLKQIEPFKDAGLIGQAIVAIGQEFGRVDLQEIDKILREQNSETYFVALPIEELPEYEAKMPPTPDVTYPFYLWMCVNGMQEYQETLRSRGLSHDENLSRLPNTGMLMPRKNSPTARRMNAPLN